MNMRSPICLLEKQIAGAPFNIAPEKASSCKQVRDDNQIQFILADEPGFGIKVRRCSDSQTPEIILPIAALEYLWAFAHYCWVLTQEYAAAQRTGAVQFDCVGIERLRNSNRILQWAKENLDGTGSAPWPAEGPRPTEDLQRHDDASVATELFLCAIAWILHHEIGHVALNHPLIGTSFAEQEERQADQYATNWLLEDLPSSDPRTKKRILGITVALLCLQSLEVNSNLCLRNTHPAAHDRIFNNLRDYLDCNNEVVPAFSSVILQYLFHETSITANVDANSFSEILGDLLYDITRNESGGQYQDTEDGKQRVIATPRPVPDSDLGVSQQKTDLVDQ